jgi:hypothetical protein
MISNNWQIGNRTSFRAPQPPCWAGCAREVSICDAVNRGFWIALDKTLVIDDSTRDRSIAVSLIRVT